MRPIKRTSYILLFILTLCAGMVAAAEQRDFAWEQQALQEAEARQAAGPVRITREVSSHRRIEVDFELDATYDEPRVRMALCVSDSPVTSVSVTAVASGPDGSTQTVQPVAGVEDLGWVRGFKIARVYFLTTAPTDHKITTGTVLVQYGDAPERPPRNADWIKRETRGAIYSSLKRLVANPSGLPVFIAHDPAQVPSPVETDVWNLLSIESPFRLKIPVEATGLFRISGADLQSSGVEIAQTNPQHLRLFCDGQLQPLHYVPSKQGTSASTAIAPDDQFVFYGRESASIYSAVNTYWLMAALGERARSFGEPARVVPVEGTGRADLFIDTMRVEEDHPPVLTRNDQFLTILGYRWAWWTWTEAARAPVPNPTPPSQSRQIMFDLPGLYATGGDVTARVYMYNHVWPAGSGPFTVRVTVNDADPVDLVLESAYAEDKDFRLPAAAFREKDNVANFELIQSGASDGVAVQAGRPMLFQICFDRLELDYPRQYSLDGDALRFRSPRESPEVVPTVQQVASTTSPRTITYELTGVGQARASQLMVVDITDTTPLLMKTTDAGHRVRFQAREESSREYLATYVDSIPRAQLVPLDPQPDLRGASQAADYIIIAHPSFLQNMNGFAEKKRQAGHAVELINIDHLYDQFSAGQSMPHAIRRFIHFATLNWKGSDTNPAASYVLFVGDSSSAYRDEFRNGIINYVPSMTVGETNDRYASDLWFGTGLGNDLLADSLVGRFSVNSSEDLKVILEKHKEYATAQPPAPWQNTLSFVADHSEFEGSVGRLIDQSVPSRFFLDRLMLSEEPWIDNYYFPLEIAEAKKSKVSPVMTARIRDMFNAGTAMVTYFGHGSPNVWSNERIWFGGDSENSDNRMLTNRDMLAFIINMTCNSGAIDYPMPRWNICISEDFMRIPNGGAIACYVPSGPGITTQHERLTMELNRTILQERIGPLGPALALANWRYLNAENPPDLTRMFILLGDPSLRLNLVPPGDEKLAGDFNTALPANGVQLPPAIASSGVSGWYQFISHAKDFVASGIDRWTTGATSLVRPDSMETNSAIVSLLVSSEDKGLAVALAAGTSDRIEILKFRSQSDPTNGQFIWNILLRNNSRLAVSGAALRLRDKSGNVIASSKGFRLEGRGGEWLTITMPLPSRVTRLYPELLLADVDVRTLSTENPLVALPDEAINQEPAAIDPDSIQATYTCVNGVLQASLVTRVYNMTSATLQDVSLVGRPVDGDDKPTTVSVPGIPPRSSATATLTLPEIPEKVAPYRISLVRNGASVGDGHEVSVGSDGLGDILLEPAEVTFSPESPMDGETVFFEAVIRNVGKSTITGVHLEGYEDVDTTSPRIMESRVSGFRTRVDLDSGSSETIRLRWDPFRNAGHKQVILRAVVSGRQAELRDDNNEATVTLKVRTKSRVRPVGIRILPLTAEDREVKQIRVAATLRNDGESAAQGVKVVFYPTQKVTPNDVMGEVILDVVPAGSTREAVLTYKLKPGEETRPFSPTTETMLKGSLQRTPLELDQDSQ